MHSNCVRVSVCCEGNAYTIYTPIYTTVFWTTTQRQIPHSCLNSALKGHSDSEEPEWPFYLRQIKLDFVVGSNLEVTAPLWANQVRVLRCLLCSFNVDGLKLTVSGSALIAKGSHVLGEGVGHQPPDIHGSGPLHCQIGHRGRHGGEKQMETCNFFNQSTDLSYLRA